MAEAAGEKALTQKGLVPTLRITTCNEAPVNAKGGYVLYWMTAFRRPSWNFALDRAVEWAGELRKPVVVLEPLRCDYPWASDRLHAFVLEGMAENARELAEKSVLYYPYAERKKGEGKGLLEAISLDACVIIGDDFPCFFLPSMIQAAAGKVKVRMEKVDANGLIPLRLSEKVFFSAYHFRRFAQKHLPPLLNQQPRSRPFTGQKLPGLSTLPMHIAERWPPLSTDQLKDGKSFVKGLPIDHQVLPVGYRGGTGPARSALKSFLEGKLSYYKTDRNHPDRAAESGLSPYLHFGHISSHEIVSSVLERQDWTPSSLKSEGKGQREGWWGLNENAEAFLDQIITWRELGSQYCHKRPDYHEYDSLPSWALKTLREHEGDLRPRVYTLKEFEEARTHDPVWNAAQRQLLVEGRIHNYLRMLWGKKILHWTPSPKGALRIMEWLNNRYALDGRDPNSYTGIFWVLGRHDRAWGPERPVFGKVRYMTSESAVRKLQMKEYLEKWALV
jgi:deoxyribodipyrimidine photo-lyase